MPHKTAWFSWWYPLALTTSIVIPCASASADGNGARATVAPPRHADPAIRRALAQLSTPVTVPIEVIDTGKLSPASRREIGRACTFVRVGVPRIYVTASCLPYQRAAGSLLDAMKLAALFRHEVAHLEGADELEARQIELRTFRALVQNAAADDQTPGMVYATAIERYIATLPTQRARRATTPEAPVFD